MRRIRRVFYLVIVLYLAWLTFLFFAQRRMLFPGTERPYAAEIPAEQGLEDLEVLHLEVAEGRIEALLLPGRGVAAESPGPLVIFAHGNYELIDDWVGLMRFYRAAGFSVLLPEFRGYGRSAGSPSEAAITGDFVRWYDLVVARPEVDPSRVVLHGRSLGGGFVCALAAQRPPAAMILQSTFTSAASFASRYGAPGFLMRDPLRNLPVVAALKVPLLIFHGRHDRVIPFAHAEALRDAARDARLVAWDSGHNDAPVDEPPFASQVLGFLQEAGLLGTAGPGAGEAGAR